MADRSDKTPSRQVRRHELWLQFKREMYEKFGGETRAQRRILARAKVKTVYGQKAATA